LLALRLKVESGLQISNLLVALADGASGVNIKLLGMSISASLGTLVSLCRDSTGSGHHAGAEDALRLVICVVVHSLKVVLDDVVLAFILVTSLEDVTSLESGHRRSTIAKVGLLLSLILNLGVERAGHVGVILRLLGRVLDASLTSERVERFVK